MNRNQYFNKHQNLNIRREELERKFRAHLKEQENMEMMRISASQYSSGGGGTVSSACLGMVVNTENELTFEFIVYTSAPVELTIEWGDGNVQVENLGIDQFSIDHIYSLGQDYNVQICFNDPSVITRLRFDGRDDDFSVLKTITGLQNFINLNRFDADDNALQSVDLSGLSNLTYVEIGDNFIVGTSTPSLTSVNLSGCTALEELNLDDSNFSGGIPDLTGLTNLKFLDVDDSDISGSVDISFLPSLDDFDFSLNLGLTELIISSSQPLGFNNQYVNASGCGLTQASVDAILVALSLNGISGATIDVSGGTNATPGAAGLAAKTVLEGNGWQVFINI
jgi:hypothetical protein